MKRISIVCLSGLLFFAACHNTGSSTVGTYEQEETSESSEKSERESHGAAKGNHEGESHEQSKEETESATTDTVKEATDTTAIPHDSSTLKAGPRPE